MNRKRPLITILFPAILLFVLFNSCQRYNDEDDFIVYDNENDFVVRFMRNTAVTITGYKGTSKDVMIPPRINNLPVTKIEKEAFRSRGLTSVIIPDSVWYIGDWAFASNKIKHIILPRTIGEIGYGAFAYNEITEVVLPDRITKIEKWTFAYNKLTSITIPESVVIIVEEAFINNRLTELIIPKNVISIGMTAFGNDSYEINNMNNITRVTIGGYVLLNMGAIGNYFTSFYNSAVRKRGGTYIYSDHYWRPENKSIPVYIFEPTDGWNSPDIEFLLDMPDLENVVLRNNDLLTDITPLSELTNIKTLEIYNCPNIENIKPLSSLVNLESLYLTHNNNYDYRDIAPQKLENLIIHGDPLGEIDLSSIGQLHYLRFLTLGKVLTSTTIKNINELRNLVNLEKLKIYSVGNLNISWISGLRKLTELDFFLCNINDISPLANLPNLVNIDLAGNKIKDITPLLNSNSIKYISVLEDDVEAGISDDLRSRFKQKNVYLTTFFSDH